VIRRLAEEPRLNRNDLGSGYGSAWPQPLHSLRLDTPIPQRPKTSSLLPWKLGRGDYTRFLDKSREDLLTACIKDFYLVSAMYYRIKRRWPYSPYGPSYGRRIDRRETAANLWPTPALETPIQTAHCPLRS
jgi:hypothetical protein